MALGRGLVRIVKLCSPEKIAEHLLINAHPTWSSAIVKYHSMKEAQESIVVKLLRQASSSSQSCGTGNVLSVLPLCQNLITITRSSATFGTTLTPNILAGIRRQGLSRRLDGKSGSETSKAQTTKEDLRRKWLQDCKTIRAIFHWAAISSTRSFRIGPVGRSSNPTQKGKVRTAKDSFFTCLTCLKVGNYNQKQWGAPCQGSKAPPSSGDVCRWKKLQKSPTNRDMLLGLWKVTKSQADKKFDRLVEQGVEPHPGPLANEPKPRSSCPSTRQTSTVPMHRYLQCQPACRGSHVSLTAGVSPRRESRTGPMQITAKHVWPASMQKQNVFTLSQNSLRGGAQKINGNPTQNPDGSNNGCDEMTDNEESDDPDPTPSCKTFGNNAKCRSDAQILSVNVRDAPGLWRLLKVITDNPTLGDIWCIQEPCLRPDEFIAVHQKFSQLGFRAHYSIGKNGQKATGGVLIAVRSTIPHQVLHKHALDDHQHLLISCSSWLIGSSYIPPRQNLIIPANQTLSSILSKFQASAGDRPWLHTGTLTSTRFRSKRSLLLFRGSFSSKPLVGIVIILLITSGPTHRKVAV